MKLYRVYIAQINQQYYDVAAKTRESAITKAQREWKEDNGPTVQSVVELKLDIK